MVAGKVLASNVVQEEVVDLCPKAEDRDGVVVVEDEREFAEVEVEAEVVKVEMVAVL